jgi:CRP-like cAMP-binding protein
MAKRNPLEPRWQALLDVTLVPAVARLPDAVPTERRNTAARHALLCRIHSEFEEMRGLSLTRSQAAKMFGLPPEIASRILERLIDARVLRQRSDGQFTLLVEEV